MSFSISQVHTRKSTFLHTMVFSFVSISPLLLMLLSYFLGGCHNTTQPQALSISGRVTLENDTGDSEYNPVDNSGVKIALYEEATIDSVLIRINAQHPSIGMGATQERYFDHRMFDPVAVTESDVTGDFSFQNVEPGVYVVAMIKNGWSIKYSFGVSKTGMDIVELPDTTLYPVRSLSGFIDQVHTFESERCYLIESDCSFTNSVVLEPGSNIYVSEGVSVRFFGQISTPGSSSDLIWKFTSSHGMFETQTVTDIHLHRAGSLVFYQSSLAVSHGFLSYFTDAITVNSAGCSISNIIIDKCATGISCTQTDVHLNKLSISNVNYTAISNIASNGSFVLENSIIKNATTGVTPLTSGSFSIRNNYFTQIGIAIDTANNNGSVQNNVFFDNSLDVKLYQAVATIDRNNFYSSKIKTISMHYPTSIINYNNFYSTGGLYFDLLSNPPSYSAVLNDVDARHNYWKDVNFMEDIIDHHTNPECPHSVIVLPKSSVPISNSGIQ